MNPLSGYKRIPVKTWFLTFAGSIPEAPSVKEFVSIELWENPSVKEYLELYVEVGRKWGWSGRLLKSAEELAEILQSEVNEVWLFLFKNEVAGFFELVRSEQDTEIVYLGLKPEWIGKGLGQKLIQVSIYVAGQNGEKVWLHTCERDHSVALQAYQKSGFKIEKEITSMEYYPE